MLNFLYSINPEIRAPIAVSLGAIPGALSRYYLTVLSARWFGNSFPYATFWINLTGALAMGFFVTWTLEKTITSPDLRLLVAVGFLGSYTTFSTYSLDTMALLQTGNYGIALFYWMGSAALGVVCVELGSFLARKLL
ncbi:fluoride efflux transporter CrcB [Scytonema sp. UIC 10036]|uniref:fluoride efflux transporter CrcB n=1 Tax=Scytonema sp. UIC 10036 TaxID=2304196 RepID=UPI0012DAA07E|nr:fluoride efflux transporter CrcB [Scytonema sp. UIC 10036]MUG91149.1 fluoride efflux transporter CrcB [Scytonema sp. UIC 10036]